MAFVEHSFRVKHLIGTTGCPHYGGLAADINTTTKCSTNGCNGTANRACHVIMVNQNAETGVRHIVYCCASCNGQRQGQVNDIRANAKCYVLEDCACGTL